MLKDKPTTVWHTYVDLHPEYLDILGEHEEGISLLVEAALDGKNGLTQLHAVTSLRKYADLLESDTKSFLYSKLTEKIETLDISNLEPGDFIALFQTVAQALTDKLKITPEERTEAGETLRRIAETDPAAIKSIETFEDFRSFFDRLGSALQTTLLTDPAAYVEDIYYYEDDEDKSSGEFIGYGLVFQEQPDNKDSSPRQIVWISRPKSGYLNLSIFAHIRNPDGQYDGKFENIKDIFYLKEWPVDRPIEISDFGDGDTVDRATMQRYAREMQNFARKTYRILTTGSSLDNDGHNGTS